MTTTRATPTTQPAISPPKTRLSFTRLFVAVLVLSGCVLVSARWTMAIVAEVRLTTADIWVSPYVDVTLTPTLHFEDPAEQPSGDVVLAFIVADPADACTPSWGSYYSLDAASRALDLDRRIVRLRERGGDAVVSFGGLLNDEIAVVCEDPAKLVAAYQMVIDRYDLTVVDFDIEGAQIANGEANARRAAAIVELQRANPDLQVWLTLPVAPHGLDAGAIALIDTTLQAGVNLAGVNVMTMNYSASLGTMNVREGNEAALLATFQQVDGAYQRAGTPLTEKEIWGRIGATPMIGQNDVPGEVFTLGDARAMMSFAQKVHLGRVSFWSANRDIQCGAVVDDARASNTCSGVKQQPREFSRLFAAGMPAEDEKGAEETPTPTGAITRDDPRTSPYPIWRSVKSYTEGAKVVWSGRVYEAKWWTEGNQPDAPVKEIWDTPWRYLGPVLELDRAAIIASKPVANGTYPRWSGEKVYVAGDVAQHDTSVFRAKWWTQGTQPQEDPDQPYDHPWEYLGEAEEIEKPLASPAPGAPITRTEHFVPEPWFDLPTPTPEPIVP